ncbi:MAG: hypothetical protein QXO75_09720, partial [Nitrososphaerota archaeon]
MKQDKPSIWDDEQCPRRGDDEASTGSLTLNKSDYLFQDTYSGGKVLNARSIGIPCLALTA